VGRTSGARRQPAVLNELRIRNFAIIESLTLPLAPGLNVLTGETGAGKSIIVGALGILLGERASTELIRPGADRAMVEGEFSVQDRDDVGALLDELGIESEDGQLVLRREIAAGGRARAWINDVSATAATLARIGRLLVNIHGQHDAQALLDTEAQRAILDAFGSGVTAARDVRDAYARVAAADREIATLEHRRAQAAERADYLRHVSREIESAELSAGEESRLEEEANRLENADELRTLAAAAAGALEGEEEGAISRVAAVRRSLSSMRRMDASLGDMEEALDAAHYTLEELAREFARYAASVDLDPTRLEEVRARRELIHALTRKHGTSVEGLLEISRKAREELDLLDSAGLDRRELDRRRTQALEQLRDAAERLSALRRAAAAKLKKEVDPLLPALGMSDGSIEVALRPRQNVGDAGAEDVEFLVALNVGHEARPLARVASGGELSRVMLALKTVLARVDRIPTLIFDEVDAGIGGRVALQVGDTMRQVAAFHQVLAISHLPQIASRAHQHVTVTKDAGGGVTSATVAVVDGKDREVELARMLGGDPESELSRAHARELLASAESGRVQVSSGRRGSRSSPGARSRG
jgi:DNA repair protein RecN (Recombination protein N)